MSAHGRENCRIPETAEQAKWRAEFQEAGENEVRQNLLNGAIYNSPPKRDFARQWLREHARASFESSKYIPTPATRSGSLSLG